MLVYFCLNTAHVKNTRNQSFARARYVLYKYNLSFQAFAVYINHPGKTLNRSDSFVR